MHGCCGSYCSFLVLSNVGDEVMESYQIPLDKNVLWENLQIIGMLCGTVFLIFLTILMIGCLIFIVLAPMRGRLTPPPYPDEE